MEGLGHAVEALVGIDQQGFGGLEALARSKAPVAHIRMQADGKAGMAKVVHRRLGQEAAGIDQGLPPYPALELGGALLQDGQEGVLLMAGGAAPALHAGNRLVQGHPLRRALPAPTSLEVQQVVVAAVQGNAGGKHAGQLKGRLARVFHGHAPRQHVVIGKHGVHQAHPQAQQLVLQQEGERLGLVRLST